MSFFLFLLTRAFIVCSLFILCSAQPTEWDDAFYYLNFGGSAPHPYVKYDPKLVSTKHKTYTNEDGKALGAYGSHMWAAPSFTYMLDLTNSGFSHVDLKIGFAEIYKLSCRMRGRSFDIHVNGESLQDVNIFALVRCLQPHDIFFHGVDATKPINITMVSRLGNPMISNLVARQSTDAITLPPATETPTTTIPTEETTTTTTTTATAITTTAEVTTTELTTETTTTTVDEATQRSEPATPSGPISELYPDRDTAIVINAGAGTWNDNIPGTNVIENTAVTVQNTVRPSFFAIGRTAKKFSYAFAGDGSSKYQIQLGFAETDPQYCNGDMNRIFSVSLNGEAVNELRNLNVSNEVACRHAFIWTHPGYLIPSKLYITFEASVADAMVSYILVRKLPGECVPESRADGQTADHLAHSVPGEYPVVRTSSSRRSYPDADGNGYETVRINGDGSHTHFFDVNSGIIGRVTRYLWTSPDTTEFISDRVSYDFNFYKGTTRMFLYVEDNVCSNHTSETTVTVTGSITGGSYCYFYSGESTQTEGEGIDIQRKPDFAKWYPSMNWDFSGLPIASAFSARCFFFLETPEDATSLTGMLKTTGQGVTSLLRGSEVIVDHSTGTSFNVSLVASLTAFELRYVRAKTDVTPAMSIEIDSGFSYKVLYDSSTVFPVITDLRPSQSDLKGLSEASFLVIGPVNSPEAVQVGSQSVPINRIQWSPKRVYLKIPPVNASEEADIFLKWPGGITSNNLKFKYIGGPVEDPVAFQHYVVMNDTSGKRSTNDFTTTIRIGSDGDLYLGTLGARVLRVKYDMDKMTTQSTCGSKPLIDQRFKKDGVPTQRDILGMVFDPRDTRPRPYVATQTLYWWDKERIDRDNTMAWRNGAIERLKPGSDPSDPSICLVYDRKIVWSLPVSNHDHGTNGLEFTNDGDLLVSVGGFTNTGLPSRGLGLVWEVPLSATILKFKLSKGSSFNGEVKYTNDTHPQLGKALDGDYEILATGVRNAFFLSLHSSGRLYTVDNGPNVGFGNVAVNCDEVNTVPNYPLDPPTDYPGTVQVREGWKRFSIGRPDRLLWIKMNETSPPPFYGHPHLHRDQCAWIDPFTHRDVLGREPPSNYERHLVAVTSSVNPVVEYHAGVFGTRLQGQLIMSTYKNRATYAIPPITRPRERQPVQLSKWGGLSAVVNARGDIIIPRLQANNFLVLRPVIPRLQASEKMSISGVTPFRYGRRGRTTATIYGYNFGTSGWIRVRIDGRVCHIYSRTNNMIRCRVPWARRRGMLVDVFVSRGGGKRATLKNGVWYMNV